MGTNIRWTKDEIEILKEIYPYGTWEEILSKLPRHKRSSIISKASKCKIKKDSYKWRDEEIQLLIEAYENNITPSKISETIFNGKITVAEIYLKASSLGIGKFKTWHDWEIEFLKENYGKITVEEIRKTIKKQKQSIIRMANKLRLTSNLKDCFGKPWSSIEDDFIKENYLKYSDIEMTKHLEGRTWRSIKWRRESLGLEVPVVNNYGRGCVNEDGIVFGSNEEMLVFDFIKSCDFFKYIKSIGNNHSKKGSYVFELNESWNYSKFYPDFVVEYINIDNEKVKLDKPLIIEYYGMARFNRKNNDIIDKYNQKTIVKEEYYKSRSDISYIGIFPNDINNNFEILNDKLNNFIENYKNIN